LSRNRQESEEKKRVRVSSEPQSSIPELPARGKKGRGSQSRFGTSGPVVRGAQPRAKVDLDPNPSQRRLPELPREVSSGYGTDASDNKRLGPTIEIRMTTLAMLGLGTVLLLCLAFIGGRSTAPEAPNSVVTEMPRDDSWPVLNPSPEEEPALRNVVDSNGDPLDPPVVDSTAIGDGSVPEEVTAPVAVQDRKLWAVMIGQKLSKDAEIIDQLLTYVDLGLTDAKTRIRVSQQRTGVKRCDVYVGPFESKQEARNALSQLMELRPTLGIRFADAYITQMIFSAEELEALKR